jgi:hypothetical protein
MDAHVYTDKGLSSTINNKLIPIKPQAASNRNEFYRYCKIFPTMNFFDQYGNLIRKVEGRTSLEDMKKVVEQVLTSNCTGMDEALDETSETHKGNVCCEGLVKRTKNDKTMCVKQSCVENSDLGFPFDGDAREALACCDDSADRRVISKISGFLVHCADQNLSKEIDHGSRSNSKSDLPPGTKSKKKVIDSAVIPY